MGINLSRPSRTVHLCTDMSLQAEHDRAVEALKDAEREEQRDARLGGKSPTVAAAKKVQDIESEMRKHQLAFELVALPRKVWAELEAAHPARKDDDVDQSFRVNVSTFVDAAMAKSVKSVTDPDGKPVEFDAATEWTALADEMSDGQWQAFAVALFNLNRGPAAPDFSRAASRVIRNSSDS